MNETYLRDNLQRTETAFRQLGYQLLVATLGSNPKTRYDVLKYFLAVVYLLANFQAPPGYRHTSGVCRAVKYMVFTLNQYYEDLKNRYGVLMLPTLTQGRMFAQRHLRWVL